MEITKARKKLFHFLLAACLVSLILLCVTCYNHFSYKDKTRSAQLKNEKEKSVIASQKIDDQIKPIEDEVKAIAALIGKGSLSSDELAASLKKPLQMRPLLQDVGVFYLQSPLGEAKQDSLVMRVGDAGSISRVEITPDDFTSMEWFKQATVKGPTWSDPFFEEGATDLLIAYTVPIYSTSAGDKSTVAVVRGCVSLEKLRDFMASLDLGNSGFAYLYLRTGVIVYHPIHEVVKNKSSLQQLIKEIKNADFAKASEVALPGGSSFVDYFEPISTKRFHVFYEPLPATAWILSAIYPEESTNYEITNVRRQKIEIALSGIVFLTIIFFLLSHAYDFGRINLWMLSTFFTLLCIIGTCFIWYLAISAPLSQDDNERLISDNLSLSQFKIEQYRFFKTRNIEKPSFIRTGISIQNMEFSGANNITFTGLIWQKYILGQDDHLSRGFELPEAKTISIREAYHKTIGNKEIIGWYFKAEVREYFDYSKYPFDRPDIWLWIRHKDLDKNVILVPDLSSYRFTYHSANPGLEEDRALPGYDVMGTYFSFRQSASISNYGLSNRSSNLIFPELFFNVIVRRNFVTPFVSSILPLIIITSMLFIVMLMLSQDELMSRREQDEEPLPDGEGDDKSGKNTARGAKKRTIVFGASGIGVIGTIITFFFTTLLSQVNLRSQLIPDRLLFIEYFHIIMYVLFLLVSLNAFYYIEKRNIEFIQYDHNLIPKLLYWPFIALTVLVVSLLHFY